MQNPVYKEMVKHFPNLSMVTEDSIWFFIHGNNGYWKSYPTPSEVAEWIRATKEYCYPIPTLTFDWEMADDEARLS